MLNNSINAYPARTWSSQQLFPDWPMPILSRTWLLPASTSLPLGTDTEASLLPTLKCQPKGDPDQLTLIPINTSFLGTLPYLSHICDHQARAYLIFPGPTGGNYSNFSSFVQGYGGILSIDPARSPKRSDSYLYSTCNFPLSHSVPAPFVTILYHTFTFLINLQRKGKGKGKGG